MDWKKHMMDNVLNWLLQDKRHVMLDKNFLMLFGNPYLFQKDKFMRLFDNVEEVGVFYKATYKKMNISFSQPLFGAPMTSMYVEVLSQTGVKNIIACGYVGGLTEDDEIGSYVIPTFACGMDGTTKSYFPYRCTFPSTECMTQALCDALHNRGVKYKPGPIVSIDALMLEDDKMIGDFRKQKFCCVDLETSCLYALGSKLGLNVSSIHIVSDNPSKKMIDEKRFHEGTFIEQVEIALAALGSILYS